VLTFTPYFSMKLIFLLFLPIVAALNGAAKSKILARSRGTDCGKGFNNLSAKAKAYFNSAFKALWKHPYHTHQWGTFEPELECWFAFLITKKCGNLPSQADSRKKELTRSCQDVDASSKDVKGLFTSNELLWFKGSFPIDKDDRYKADFRQSMATAYRLNQKEMLCLTLFTIDDNCVNYKYVRTNLS